MCFGDVRYHAGAAAKYIELQNIFCCWIQSLSAFLVVSPFFLFPLEILSVFFKLVSLSTKFLQLGVAAWPLDLL
jgi:hypothetical protein